MDFLFCEDLCLVWFQFELLKIEFVFDEVKIVLIFVFYGFVCILEFVKVQVLFELVIDEKFKKIVQSLVDKLKYYDVVCEFVVKVSVLLCDEYGWWQFVVCLGGGLLIMEVVNCGVVDVGVELIGFNIVLLYEQVFNFYVIFLLLVQFYYFVLWKMYFLFYVCVLVVFLGGFGMFDELFELLMLIQIGKIQLILVLLFGCIFWDCVVNFEVLVEEGVVSEKDFGIFYYVEIVDEVWDVVQIFYCECVVKEVVEG